VQVQEITQLIQSHLPDANIIVQGDAGKHFQATIICESFSGVSPVKRQQKVNAAVSSHIQSGALHALSLKTLTPQEWQAKAQEQ